MFYPKWLGNTLGLKKKWKMTRTTYNRHQMDLDTKQFHETASVYMQWTEKGSICLASSICK